MWSLFLLEHLYLSGIWCRFIVKNGHKKVVAMLNLGYSFLCSIANTMISSERESSLLSSYNSQRWFWNLNWQSEWFSIANQMWQSSNFNAYVRPKSYVELEAHIIFLTSVRLYLCAQCTHHSELSYNEDLLQAASCMNPVHKFLMHLNCLAHTLNPDEKIKKPHIGSGNSPD